jgi:GT2 family glycosyltransferase
VIDDGRLDETVRGELAEPCRCLGVRFDYKEKPRPNRSLSRNMAADLAVGDAVLYLDDDCVPEPDFARRLLEALESPAGKLLLAVEGDVLPHSQHDWYHSVLGLLGWWGLTPHPPRDAELPAGVRPARYLGGVMMVRRDVLTRERFDESLAQGEDREFSVRVARHGLLGRVPEAICHHLMVPSGRANPFAAGVRMSRSYLYSQRKLFGPLGLIGGVGTVTMMSLLHLSMVVFNSTEPIRSAGMLVGLITPWCRRGEH